MKAFCKDATDLPDRTISIKAHVKDTTLMMREQVATTELPDGTKVELAMFGPIIVVTLSDPRQPNTWRSYIVKPEELVRSILRAEEVAP